MSQQSNRTFDELASGLASGTLSRGKALRLMGAALVGGTLASVGIREAGADQCKPNGKACKKHTQCCSGNCADGTCSSCPAGRVELENGTCVIERDPNACFCPTNCFCRPENALAGPGGTRRWFCASDEFPDATCNVNSDCPEGQFCTRGLIGEGPHCAVAC